MRKEENKSILSFYRKNISIERVINIGNKFKVSLKPKNILNDGMVNEIKLHSKYVSEGIGEDYKQWNEYNPVFISAQTGMGKNTFIEEVLIKVASEIGLKILIVSNRIANSRQQKERIADLVGCKRELEYLTDKGLDHREDFCNVKVMTYQKLDSYLDDIMKSRELSHYQIVIFDEVHYFLSDSLFNSKTGRALNNSLRTFKSSIRIYMTATPEEILPIIIEKEKLLYPRTLQALYGLNYTVRPKEILYYNFKRNYDYVNPKYFNSKDEILEIIENDKSENKWLIFVNSKDDGNYFVEQLGDSAVFITAESKESKDDDNIIYSEIVQHEKFSCKVLVTTSVLDNGVNFKDNLLKNVAVLSSDKTEFLQMFGRKRRIDDEKVNLYICARDINYFNSKLRNVDDKIKAICCFKKNYSLFFNEYFLGNDKSKYKIAKQLFYLDKNSNLQLNDLAEKKLYKDKIFIEKMINKLKSGYKEAFIIEQLSWMGLQKTYSPESWVSYVDSNNKIADFIKFLDGNCDIELTPDKFAVFSEKFKELVYVTYGRQPGDRKNRPYKETKMRTIFKNYSLNYNIEIKNKIYILRKND